jgi:hypothetical protein
MEKGSDCGAGAVNSCFYWNSGCWGTHLAVCKTASDGTTTTLTTTTTTTTTTATTTGVAVAALSPPNITEILLSESDASTNLDGAFWNTACLKIPASAKYVVVEMTEVRDFYRPIQGATFCQMLLSNHQHEWSANGINWVTPRYSVSAHTGKLYGGSFLNWPKQNVSGDARKQLSFWGYETADGKGGCCSTSYADYDTPTPENGYGWGQSFSVAYGVAATIGTTTTTVTDATMRFADCNEVQNQCSAECETAIARTHTIIIQPSPDGAQCKGPTDCRPGIGECRAPTIFNQFEENQVVLTKWNDGALSCLEYCGFGVNGESAVGSSCTVAMRGLSASIYPPTACVANGRTYVGSSCIACTEAGLIAPYSSERDPLTCWCTPPAASSSTILPTQSAVDPSQESTNEVVDVRAFATDKRPLEIVLNATAWKAADWFGVNGGWDSTVPLQSIECPEQTCPTDAKHNGLNLNSPPPTLTPSPTCRSNPYTFLGIPPPYFRDFLLYRWRNGSESELPPHTPIEVVFSLEWDAVAGHGRTGPGGFEIDPVEGGILAAIPQQAGFYHAAVHASVRAGLSNGTIADVDADNMNIHSNVPAFVISTLQLKRFGFRVEGRAPFEVHAYTRSMQLCKEAAHRGEEEVAEMYLCESTIGHLDCFGGSSNIKYIAPITLNNTVHQVGKSVRYVLKGAPRGFMVGSKTGEITASPPLQTIRTEQYTVELVAIDEAGSRALVESFTVKVSKKPATPAQSAVKDTGAAVGAALGTIIGLLLFAVGGYQYRIHQLKYMPTNFDTEFAAMLAAGLITEDQLQARRVPREIKRSDLDLLTRVGSGQFGDVYKALLDESNSSGTPEYTVAAKTVRDAEASPQATQELMSEAVVMAQVQGDAHLVSIIGVITRGDPLVLVISFCEFGSLFSVLKTKAANGAPIEFCEKMIFASEVAHGMEHLHKLHFIHRDLAARNVLLAAGKSKSGMVSKVADFGLSRAGGSSSDGNEDYYKSSSGVFPVRWTAPEAMETHRFTSASDVWSLGIVIIELLVDGENPYHGMSNPDVMNFTIAGNKHPQPTGCPHRLYAMLLKCWDVDPAHRPDCRLIGEQVGRFATAQSNGTANHGIATTYFGVAAVVDNFVSANNSYTAVGDGPFSTGTNVIEGAALDVAAKRAARGLTDAAGVVAAAMAGPAAATPQIDTADLGGNSIAIVKGSTKVAKKSAVRKGRQGRRGSNLELLENEDLAGLFSI